METQPREDGRVLAAVSPPALRPERDEARGCRPQPARPHLRSDDRVDLPARLPADHGCQCDRVGGRLEEVVLRALREQGALLSRDPRRRPGTRPQARDRGLAARARLGEPHARGVRGAARRSRHAPQPRPPSAGRRARRWSEGPRAHGARRARVRALCRERVSRGARSGRDPGARRRRDRRRAPPCRLEATARRTRARAGGAERPGARPDRLLPLRRTRRGWGRSVRRRRDQGPWRPPPSCRAPTTERWRSAR